MSTVQSWAGAAAVLGVILTALTLTVTVVRPLRRFNRQWDDFRLDWYGTPARPGRDRVPGVPERLALIEQGLTDHITSHGRSTS
ncbi:hypothetical protein [Micromonospora sp. HUAS LYJ1]|uniref:hypothetical protein n=1 Tax=Micromonospora sp. HUAS LYJ1 TaxID=3061626 RepID=UPI002671E7F2|nr:hypothetical protein [Micromonospora sp. HUAS LYJ1]WKU03842.1 hypothetical protein Q2K16_23830 [Micromonospora sp. HUAS LYJ1]